MTLVPYLLVLVSAFPHADWNFVLKRTKGTHVFVGLSKLVELVPKKSIAGMLRSKSLDEPPMP